jgi:hypothetical protein
VPEIYSESREEKKPTRSDENKPIHARGT